MKEFPEEYPKAKQNFKLKTVGLFQDKRPLGITVHYTADRRIERVFESLKAQDLAYHVLVDRNGVVFQCAPLTHRVWHAGKAEWNGVSPNQRHLGVAVVSYGEVHAEEGPYTATWNADKIPDADVVKRKAPVSGVLAAWDAATVQQESALMRFLQWCVDQGVDPHNICGHDECAQPRGRKIDPGGVLSRDMSTLRRMLLDYQKARGTVRELKNKNNNPLAK